MGNLSFIVPTKKIEDFNIDKVYELLKVNFNYLNIELYKELKEIVIYKNDFLVTNLYFNQKCYIIDFKRDIKQLREYKQEKLADWLIILQNINPDLNNVIQMTYGENRHSDIKSDVEFFIKDYFIAYLFDEGIHPEFMPPNYNRKKEFKYLKKFF